MTSAKIFLVEDEGGHLKEMVETSFPAEEKLQILLARYPDLLPGDQINPESPCRWLLVTREFGVPDGLEEPDRWSLDHLFLDQDGVPTFVECKMASNTQARRDVVAQMLDYAANGIEYWNMERLRQAAYETAKDNCKSLDEEIMKLICINSQESIDAAIETFWTQVEENLRTGKVRLIFVSDNPPKELRRLVAFLNDKMRDVETFIIEIKQFIGEGQKAMVPRVVVGPAQAYEGISKPPLSRESFKNKCAPELWPFFEHVMDLATGRMDFQLYWGKASFSIRKHLPSEDRYASVVYCWLEGSFSFYFAQLPISEETSNALRTELLSTGIFRESGKKTLVSTLDEENLPKAEYVVELILNRVDEIASSFGLAENQGDEKLVFINK